MSFSPDGGGRRGDMALKHVFEGCRLVFWHKSHVSRMKDRVVDRGGSIAAALDKDTTHVVSGANTSLVTAAAHLAQAEHVRPSLSLDIDSMRVAAPTGVHFVLPTWITASMLKQTRQAESDHLSPFGQRLAAAMPQAHGEAAVSGPGEHSGSGSADGKGPGAKQRERAGSPPSSKTGSGLGTSPAHAPTWTGGSGAPLCDAEPLPRKKARRPQPPAPCRVERVGSEFVAIEGDTLPRFTGGDSGLPWGWAGVWEEPWDEATAMATREKLRHHWYRTARAATAPPTGKDQGGKAPRVNTACRHAACAPHPFCIVEKLAEYRSVYVEGRDQYRIKALERAIQQVAGHGSPLEEDADVDHVGLGPKSAQKVRDVLRSGEFIRVAAVAGDKRLQTLALFSGVWGAGPTTAQKWYADGARSLEDVARRPGLTAQQLTGLKYYEDIQRKMPRTEVARGEALVRAAVFDLVDTLAPGLGADGVARTYAWATGSFRRGAPESSDMDMLVGLPPGTEHVDCVHFLEQLLDNLLEAGFLLEDMMGPGATSTLCRAPLTRASWMGLFRTEASPWARRIDVKVYAHEHLPFAVNYFANSQSFCRATRHWATQAAELARTCTGEPSTTGFKLSDKEVTVLLPEGGSSQSRIACACETDIFKLLGLDYVPVTMRYFNNYF
uniref:DNA polymerase n=1 Tax=Auxenochlorella protothecoides TaxID=3075 RepID=A0A1D1ZYL6_AUXPR